MGILRGLFGPRNGLILAYDHFDQESTEEMESQLDEIGKFYQFVPLSRLVNRLRKGKTSGEAAVCFLQARKSAELRAVPRLRDRGIPFTLFLRPDCIGVNCLPPTDEWDAFAQNYPKHFAGLSRDEFAQTAWTDLAQARAILDGFRREVGPLPLNQIDPTLYFSTWGKILELPRDLREFGVHLPANAEHIPLWEESVRFIRQQTGSSVTLAFAPESLIGQSGSLEKLGITAVLTNERGIVEKGTSPWCLPQFEVEKANEEITAEENQST